MKDGIKVFTSICCLILIISFNINVLAQSGPPPPPPGSGHGQTTNQAPSGGTAPMGNGIAFLISLGIGYGLVNFYKTKKVAREKAFNS